MVRYVDERGRVHYVNTDNSKIPEQYREQVEPKPLQESEESSKENSLTNSLLTPAEPTSPPDTTSIASLPEYKIEILLTFDCQNCIQLLNFLKAHNLNYIPYDIQNSDVGKEKYREVGGGELPITMIGDEIIKGYDLKRIYDILARDKKIPTGASPVLDNKNLTKTLPPTQ